MRTFLSSIIACAAAALLFPAAASAAPAPQLKITHNTGAIYQFDPSPNGDGVLYDTVQVTAELRHCTPGTFYFRSITLVQDGVSYDWATQAMGAVEIVCTDAGTASAGMAFFGNGLHPGTAVVTVTVSSETDGSVLAEDSRTVRIPAGANNPG